MTGILFCKGTFDNFHKGHRFFLETAAGFGKKLLIGIVENPSIAASQSFETRRADVAGFLDKIRANYDILSWGEGSEKVLISSDQLSYFAANPSPDGKVALEKINQQRIGQNRAPLVSIEIPLIQAEDGLLISSARIRDGVIDVEGRRVAKKTPPVPNTKSRIRNNFIELFLGENGPLYGYQINKKYNSRYGRLSLRLTYYHLAKGVSEGIFKLHQVRTTEGGYSWGPNSERIYYELAK